MRLLEFRQLQNGFFFSSSDLKRSFSCYFAVSSYQGIKGGAQLFSVMEPFDVDWRVTGIGDGESSGPAEFSLDWFELGLHGWWGFFGLSKFCWLGLKFWIHVDFLGLF